MSGRTAASASNRGGLGDPADHLVDGCELREEGADGRQGCALHLCDVEPRHAARRRAVTEEEGADVTDHRLAGSGLTTDVRLDARDDDGVDTERLESRLQVGVVEGAEVRLLEELVRRLYHQRLVEGRRGRGAFEHPLPDHGKHLPEEAEVGLGRDRVADVDHRDADGTAYGGKAVDAPGD